MRSTIDIPDSALLATTSLEDLIGQVVSSLGISHPDVICVPMIDFSGANYASRMIDVNRGHWSNYNLPETVKKIREMGAKVYLSINPSMQFLDARPFVVRDQYGDDKTGACIVNPHIQQLLARAIQEAKEILEPDGIVLDLSDINGQNAEKGRIDFTCFCVHCTSALLKLGKFDYSVFRKHPNPINMVLKDSGTGIRHFAVNLSAWGIEDLISLSRVKNMYEPEWIEGGEKAQEWAHTVLEYMKARSRITAEAVHSVGKGFRKDGMRMAVVTCSARFDFTSGVDLDHLQGCVDELWTDTDDLVKAEIPQGLEIHHYLFSRARYLIDAYFELASDRDKLEAIAGGLTSARRDVHDLLNDRAMRLLKASQVKLSNVSALEVMEAFDGFVAPPLTESVMQKINFETLKLVPESPRSEAEAGAAQVLLLLMRLAQDGTPITMGTLQQVARRLGVFDESEME